MTHPLLGNLKKGLLIALSAPAGTGKTTLVKKITTTFPDDIVQSISCTTRKPRPQEVDGKDYIFLTQEEFKAHQASGDFLETVSVFDADYGTLRETIEKQRQTGKHVISVVDTHGAVVLKEKAGAILIFLLPPSLLELKERLKKRQTESSESVKARLTRVQFEISQMKYFDYQIVNHDLEVAYQIFLSIFVAEEHRLSHLGYSTIRK